MKPFVTFFKIPADFRAWLKTHHTSKSELLIGFYKKGSGKPSITWPESVDQALCFGWIDGVRRTIDADSYCIRFTPRKTVSVWSHVNIERFKRLKAMDVVAPAGDKAFAEGKERTTHYSYENEAREFTPEDLARFQDNLAAWDFFQACAPSYKKKIIWWVLSAKQASTRAKRLGELIEASAIGRCLDDK